MNKWIKADTSDGYYLRNAELANINTNILATYETPKGIKKVTMLECRHGRIYKPRFRNYVTAFMFLPEPYKGE